METNWETMEINWVLCLIYGLFLSLSLFLIFALYSVSNLPGHSELLSFPYAGWQQVSLCTCSRLRLPDVSNTFSQQIVAVSLLQLQVVLKVEASLIPT